ncbi:MAG TPA: DinB family protein [Thermoanaerobaculia bacterium]|nr:DinB family protein [Thermoanaerobaculia bacterium]
MLDDVEAELDDATKRAWQLIRSTDPRHFTVRPTPGSWSAAECLSHLSISTEMFLPVLRKAIDDAKARGWKSERKPSMDMLGRLLRWFLEPPIRKRVATAAPFVPKSVRAKAEAFGEFSTLQSKLVDLVQEASGLDLKRMKIVSPFDKRVKYNVYSAFLILVAHQRRHLWQAEQVIAELRRRSSLKTA